MRIFFVMNDAIDVPYGGVKQAHRMIDVLCEQGFDAAVIMPRKGFRCTWFPNETPIVFSGDVQLSKDDWLILPEVLKDVPPIEGADKCHMVVYAQNPFYITAAFGGPMNFAKFYREKAEAVMCVSDHSVDAIKKLMPDVEPLRIRYSFDREPFGPSGDKKKILAYMPRRRGDEIETAIVALQAEGAMEGWLIRPIQGLSEKKVAERMKEAAVFVSGSHREGFGMPPAEAMACGCAVVGFGGHAGEEFMKSHTSFLVPEDDGPALMGILRDVLAMDIESLRHVGWNASRYIRGEYSTEREVDSIIRAWRKILGRPLSQVNTPSPKKKRIKAVVLSWNTPKKTDETYELLAPVFDDVEVFDGGSDPDKIAVHVSRVLDDGCWTGSWNEILRTCGDYDAVWMVGDDLTFKNPPEEYRKVIESSLPFGCWSPCIEGRSLPFMRAKHYTDGKPRTVKNVEGMALALSREMIQSIEKLPEGSDGFGQDLWMCYCARQKDLPNIIDGRVRVFHEAKIRYNRGEFWRQMQDVFSKMYGPDFRRTIFEYSGDFHGNLLERSQAVVSDTGNNNKGNDMYTIATVDTGWAYSEFVRVTQELKNCRRIVMSKGTWEPVAVGGVDVIPYDESLKPIFERADVVFMPKVGSAVRPDFIKIFNAGIPIVTHISCKGPIKHMKNGYVYKDTSWAIKWLNELRNESVRAEVAANVAADSASDEKDAKSTETVVPTQAVVTVVTPTWRRNPEIVRRSIYCMMLQTIGEWRQVVCSNGPEEPEIRKMVEELGDPRVTYECFDSEMGKGDFGNTARKRTIERAETDYVMFLDDDNVVLPHYLSTMVESLKNAPDCDLAVCKIMHFGPLNEKLVGKPPIVLAGDPVRVAHIDPLQVLVRTKAIKEVGWDVETGYISDGVTLERLGDKFKVVRVNKVLGVHM